MALLLFAMAIPAFGNSISGGPKHWFHLGRGSASPHYRGNHIVVKHQVAKHPKPHHANHH